MVTTTPASELQTSLHTFEQRFAREISNVVLLGELPLTPELVTDLADVIRGLVRRQGFAEATRILTQRYPCTLAVYLVAHGIYGYRGGNYWPEIVEVMGSEAVREWGAFFRTFLQQRGLPVFQDLGGHTNLTPILTHGGIPDYSLPDFFQHVLEPLADALESSDADIEDSILEALAELARRAPADRPIERFLAHGGAVARDFVARAVELARLVREGNAAPDPAAVGLPARVVARYVQWAASRTHRRSSSTWRPRRPELWFDPWGDGLIVEFPAQQLPEGPRPAICWRVETDGAVWTRKVAVAPVGAAWETMPDRLAVGPTTCGYTIVFSDGRGFSHTWTIATWHDSFPLLAFDPESGSYVRTPRGLPARPLWLLVRRADNLEVVGGQRVGVLPTPGGEWGAYRLEHWDLCQARRVHVGAYEIPVLPDENAFRPQLRGGVLINLGLRTGDLPIYEGRQPDLIIPIPPQRSPEQELNQWKLSLISNDLSIHQQVPLSELMYAVQVMDGHLRIELARLTTETFGRFAVILRGPLGRDSSFHFGLVPRLAVEGVGRIRVADTSGALPPGVLRIKTDPSLTVVSNDRLLQVTCEADGSFTVVAPAEMTLARLSLRKRANQRQELPLTLPLPLLHWSVTGLGDGWSTNPIRCPQAWFDQLEIPELHVRLEPALQFSTTPQASLVISDPEGRLAQRLRAKGDAGRGWSFALREALDTVRSSDAPQLHGRFEMTNLPAGQHPMIVPVLRIVQDLDVSDLRVVLLERGGNWNLNVTWNQGRRVRGRTLRFWPLWRPWLAPIHVPIPDDISDHYEGHLLRTDLPPGCYRAELAIVDPWSSAERLRPAPWTEGTFDVVAGEHAARALATISHDARGALTALLSAPDAGALLRTAQRLALAPIEPHTAEDLLSTLAVFSEDPERAALLQDPAWEAWPGLRSLAQRIGVELLLATLQNPERFSMDTWAVLLRCLTVLHPDVAAAVESVRGTGMVLATHLDRITQLADATATARASLLSWLDDQGVLVVEHGNEASQHSHSKVDPPVPPVPEALLRDSFGCYLYQIGQIPLLQDDEELRLARLVADGVQAELQLRKATHDLRRTTALRQAVVAGSEARHRLITSNLRLVVSLVKRYRGRGLDDLDLIQEGNLGLMRAVEKFDHTKGFRFSTYATWWIKQALSRATADQGRLIRLPVHLHEQIMRMYAVQRQLAQQLHREPTERELAGAMGVSERKVIALLGFAQDPVSLETPVGEEEDSTLGDMIADPCAAPFDEDLIAENLQRDMEAALSHLRERERRVLRLRYGLHDGKERTLEEVGRSFGVTRERIRQIECKGLRRLKHLLISQSLWQYVTIKPEAEPKTSEAQPGDLQQERRSATAVAAPDSSRRGPGRPR